MEDREIQKLAGELVDFIEERLQSCSETNKMLRMRRATSYHCPASFECGRYREKGCKSADHSCDGGFNCGSFDL